MILELNLPLWIYTTLSAGDHKEEDINTTGAHINQCMRDINH